MKELGQHEVELTAELVSALDSPLRLRILLLLDGSPHVVHEIVGKLGKSQPLVSQHLRVLKKSNLVDASRSGREVVYSLAQPAVIDIIHELARIVTGQSTDHGTGPADSQGVTPGSGHGAGPAAADGMADLAERCRARGLADAAARAAEGDADVSGSGAAAIIGPPSDIVPARDPGLTPFTPAPSSE